MDDTITELKQFLNEHPQALVSIKARRRQEPKQVLFSVRVRHPDLQESGATHEAQDLEEALRRAMDGYDAMYGQEGGQ